MAKRKSNSENRQFQNNWEIDFFFTDCDGQPQCLLCKTKLASMKKCNISHYTTVHADTYDAYSADDRAKILKKLKMEQNNEAKTENIYKSLQQQSLAASYSVALEIAKAKKPFSDGEFIKKCAIEMAKAFGNETAINNFQTVSLSRSTISTRVSEINAHIEDKLKLLIEKCRYFSLCLDESTYISDVSQLLIFIRIVEDNFVINEELIALASLHSTTKGMDIFNAVREQMEKYGGFHKCTAIVTDGAKAMVGKTNGFWGHLKKNGINCPTFHCIIHQEALCGKIVKLFSTMKIVTKVTNLIRGGNRALLHRKFQQFSEDVNASYGDLLLYSHVRWLSAGRSLQRFFALRKDIPTFLENEVESDTLDFQKKFKDVQFLTELAFLTDITSHLNSLNLKLQKQDQTISDLIGHVNGFRNQLKLFIFELKAGELYHFSSCQEISNEYPDTCFSEFLSPLSEIEEEFNTRFKDFDCLKNNLIIFNNPKGCKIEEQEIAYRMELCDLQADPFLLSRDEHGIQFFKLLSDKKYPQLIDLGLKVLNVRIYI